VKGKTIQVISFLSAIMRKHGDMRDLDRRRNHVSDLQDSHDWRVGRTLPPADARWPTCLIIAPSTVVHNWQREFEKVRATHVLKNNVILRYLLIVGLL
jgi:SNF2 family DNA or RNA helicase